MRKSTFNRMKKLVKEINNSPLSFPITIKKLKPLEEQPNYNPLMQEWSGEKEWEVVAQCNAIFSAFKESEDWQKNGMLSIHDFKANINEEYYIDTNCIVIRDDTQEKFEVIFKREFIGENVVGLRPVVK